MKQARWELEFTICERHIINRELHTVDLLVMGNKETVRVKVAKNLNGEIIHIKPEYEDLKRLGGKNQKAAKRTLRNCGFKST